MSAKEIIDIDLQIEYMVETRKTLESVSKMMKQDAEHFNKSFAIIEAIIESLKFLKKLKAVKN